MHRDYLGSILAITDEAGAIIEKRHFDAWGNIANVADGQNNDLEKLTFFDRGYTGHEHLQGVVLIHMNGRLYDPKVHRFLQPDNYVQDPLNTQNYNRYAYCWNNPFKFSDPSGEWIWIVVAAVVGGVVNWVSHGARFDMEGLKAFGIGAAAGTIGALTGGAGFAAAGGAAGGVGGFIAGASGAALGATASQTFLSVGNNIAFGDPLMSGKDFIKGVFFSALTGGTVQGIAALNAGRGFWNGNLPMPKVSPISLPSPAGLAQTNAPKMETNSNMPPPAKTNNIPTTETNRASNVSVTKTPDGGIRIRGVEPVSAKTPVGSQSEYMNAIGNNAPAKIDGIEYSGHALDQMQGRGILSPSVVKDAIMNPLQILNGNTPNTFLNIGQNGIRVITNAAGKVITVY